MGFKDDVAAAKAKPRRTDDLTVTVNGKKHKLKFTQMDGKEWAAETLKFPARPGVQFDAIYGYDVNALVLAVAPRSGELIDGEPLTDEDWDDLFSVLNGGDHESLVNTVWALNEFATAKAVDAARKVLADYQESLD